MPVSLCDTCTMCVRSTYQKEMRTLFFRKVLKYIPVNYCLVMDISILDTVIVKCSHHIPENK